MLARLRHRPFVSGNDEQQHFHTGRTGKHIVEKALVPGDIDDPRFRTIVITQVRKAEIERHPPQLFFDEAVGVGTG